MTDFFDVPQEAEALNQSLNLGGAVTLPFSAPTFWWSNGNNQARALAAEVPALYFGGWAANVDDVDDASDFYGPVTFKKTTLSSRDGKDVEAYMARHLLIAPIAYRSCWIVTVNGAQSRYTEYVDGGRRHIQLLALLGKANPDKSYAPWGPVVLSAKGYQANHLLDSITTWQKHIEKARKQHAAAVPASGFWMMVGTFGDKAESIMVGKAGKQSPITPIRLHKPQEITLDLLKTIFVGKPALSGMADYLEQSREWLGAWKAREERQHANGNGGGKSPSVPAANEPEFDDGYIPGVDDEIPF